jgi:hypothetical protein
MDCLEEEEAARLESVRLAAEDDEPAT